MNALTTYDSAYTPDEVAAIEAFVDGGGGLLVMCENPAVSFVDNVNPVANAFDLTCAVSDVADSVVTDLVY